MFTEEEILRKFNGDEVKATAFMQVFIFSQEQKLEETNRFLNPNNEFMKSIECELGRDMDLSFMPRWKLMLVKFKLIKR